MFNVFVIRIRGRIVHVDDQLSSWLLSQTLIDVYMPVFFQLERVQFINLTVEFKTP